MYPSPIPSSARMFTSFVHSLSHVSTRAHYLVTANCILCTFGPLTAYFPCPFTNQKLLARYRRGPTANAGPRPGQRSRPGPCLRDRTRLCASCLTLATRHVLRIMLDGPVISRSVFCLCHSGVGALPSALALIWQPLARLEKDAHLAEAGS